MTTKRLHVYSAERDNEVVRRVRLWSDHDLGTSVTDFYNIRVGVTSEAGGHDFFGEWDMSSQFLSAGEPIDLTGGGDLNWPLSDGDVCVVEIELVGSSAPDLTGVSVEWKFSRVGAVQERGIQRVDGSARAAREIQRPLFSVPTNRLDPLDQLLSQLNTTGVTEWTQTVFIPDLFGS